MSLVHFPPSLFPGMEIVEGSPFRVTRDADLEVSDGADDLLEAVELERRNARFGEATRLEVAGSMFTLRPRLVEETRDVADAARAGKRARIRIEVNGLTDPAVVDELYAASCAGARIDLVVRGVCSLRPGVSGTSETTRVRSVLGRLLEHGRVFMFEAGERGAYDLRRRHPRGRGARDRRRARRVEVREQRGEVRRGTAGDVGSRTFPGRGLTGPSRSIY